jgi:hypothetical protein
MRADRSAVRPEPAAARRRRRHAHQRGLALLWAVVGLVVVSLLGVAASLITSGETLINENYSTGDQALYIADEALSQFYADFTPGSNLNLPVITTIEVDTVDGEVDTTNVFGAYSGADLKVTDLTFDSAWVRVTPTKLMRSQRGDVYLLEAEATIPDPRPSRPLAVRWLRTYADLVAPVNIRAALNAPNGITGGSDGNRLTLNGTAKGSCASGNSLPSLSVPAGSYSLKNKKTSIKADPVGIGIDSSTSSYQELKDSLRVDWTQLTSDATYAGSPQGIVIPRDYPDLQSVPWGTMSKSAVWPNILVHGNVTISNNLHGFGMLVVDGALNINHGALSWNGLILTGKALTVMNAPAKGHLHAHGAVATGLNCTAGELATHACDNELHGEHLGVDYAPCDVESAWAGMLTLRPLTPSRHTRHF